MVPSVSSRVQTTRPALKFASGRRQATRGRAAEEPGVRIIFRRKVVLTSSLPYFLHFGVMLLPRGAEEPARMVPGGRPGSKEKGDKEKGAIPNNSCALAWAARGWKDDQFHSVVWPHRDGDLSLWMQWLLTAHVGR